MLEPSGASAVNVPTARVIPPATGSILWRMTEPGSEEGASKLQAAVNTARAASVLVVTAIRFQRFDVSAGAAGRLDLREKSLGTHDRGQLGLEDLERNLPLVLEVVCQVDRGHIPPSPIWRSMA